MINFIKHFYTFSLPEKDKFITKMSLVGLGGRSSFVQILSTRFSTSSILISLPLAKESSNLVHLSEKK